MRQNLLLVPIVVAVLLYGFPAFAVDETYKSIVKVVTLVEDGDYNLTVAGYGSGFIIDSSGLILTNYHVISNESDFDKRQLPAGFGICINRNQVDPPDCNYTAEFIAGDKAKDVALLKIKPIAGMTESSVLQALKLATVSPENGSQVTAMGFPAIGSETITITSGIISGSQDKDGLKWLKTDAVISFGSSGGAALNQAGEVVGITSAASASSLGSLGYIIDMPSLASWINQSKQSSPQTNVFATRIADIFKLQQSLKTSSSYTNKLPNFQITKPADWSFDYTSENSITIDKPGDDDGGILNVSLISYNFIISDNYLKERANRIMLESDPSGNSSRLLATTLSGQPAWKISNKSGSFTITNIGRYIVVINSNYGTADKDKAIIENIIQSFKILNKSNSVTSIPQYVNQEFKFSLITNDQWVIEPWNAIDNPIGLTYPSSGLVKADFKIMKEDSFTAGLSLAELTKSTTDELNQYGELLSSIMGYNLKVVSQKSDLTLSPQLTPVIKMVLNAVKTDNQIIFQQVEYMWRHSNHLFNFTLGIYSADQTFINQTTASFEQVLKGYNNSTTVLAIPSNSQAVSAPTSPEPTDNQPQPEPEPVASPEPPSSPEPSQPASSSNTTDSFKLGQVQANLRGRIILRVESDGEAYYLNPSNNTAYFLGRPEDAFQVMRSQGVGITNNDLNKFAVGLTAVSGTDSDQDGLSDMLESALGTDADKTDSDGDGFDDKTEVANGYNPLGAGKMPLVSSFSQSKDGSIFLQIEGKGEAWYINPVDHKRYFLGRPNDAFQVMRSLGLGISEQNFEKL